MVLAFVAAVNPRRARGAPDNFGLLLPFNELFTVFSLFNTYLHHSDFRPEPDSTVCFPAPRAKLVPEPKHPNRCAAHRRGSTEAERKRV